MKNFLLFFVFIIFSKFLFAQNIKKYTGELTNDGKFGQHGSVEYSYYEDSITHDYIKHGQFKYVFVGTNDYKGYKQTITGKFDKGNKVGKWVYTINKTDYKDGYEGKFYTGIINLVADYKNGYANGKWHYFSNLKYRRPVGFGWSEYTNLGYDTVIANFKNNYVINKIHVVDKYNNFYADAYFNSNSMCDSNWKIQDNILSSISEIKFKSGLKTEVVVRELNDLSVKKVEKNNNFERLKYYNSIDVKNPERQKCKIDTISTIGSEYYFDIYFKRLLSDDNFLYKSIGGDNSFWEKFKGSYEVEFQEYNYYSLKDIKGFLENYNNYYTEDSAYKIFRSYNKNIDDFLPSERDLLRSFLKKIENVNRLGNLPNFNSSRFKNDSLGMCLIWANSTMKYDKLNMEDKMIIDTLNKLFKDTIELRKQLNLNTRLATLAMAKLPNYLPTNGLVGWWPFNGNANDESGNGNNGTVNGATLTSDRNGNVNQAFNFSHNSITLLNYPQFSGNWSISLWYKRSGYSTGYQNYGALFTTSNQIQFNGVGIWLIMNEFKMLLQSYGQNQLILEPYTYDMNWHHVVYTFNGSTISLYIDSVLKKSGQITISQTHSSPFNIGGGFDAFGNDFSFIGNIDDCGIWDRALTQQEITDLYKSCQLSINTQPASQTINSNENVQFVVGSSDSNATYQWQTDLGFGGVFKNINDAEHYSGTTNNTLTISNVSMNNHNQKFRCVITSSACTKTSAVAVLSVNDCQLSINTQPASQTININNNAQFVVGSSDSNATYQWQTNLGLGFQNLNNAGQYSGTTNNTLTVSNVTMSNEDQQFRCIITSGACTTTSAEAELTVK